MKACVYNTRRTLWESAPKMGESPQKSGIYRERRICCEGKIVSETDLRKVQGYQTKRKHPDHLRESEA